MYELYFNATYALWFAYYEVEHNFSPQHISRMFLYFKGIFMQQITQAKLCKPFLKPVTVNVVSLDVNEHFISEKRGIHCTQSKKVDLASQHNMIGWVTKSLLTVRTFFWFGYFFFQNNRQKKGETTHPFRIDIIPKSTNHTTMKSPSLDHPYLYIYTLDSASK